MMDNDIILRNVRVKGEISNLKYHSTGIYFTLKDEIASLKCVMFNEYGKLLNFTLQDGMSVIVTGRISVYERNGTYQLYAQSIQSDGIGALYFAFNKLKEKLQKEGLLILIKRNLSLNILKNCCGDFSNRGCNTRYNNNFEKEKSNSRHFSGSCFGARKLSRR